MKNNGFTLIELSIVLVIIGLIIGGVMVGQDMIYASKVRRMVGDAEQYSSAVNTFKLKYNCLPGDCANATDFLSGVSNGNGDGAINPISSQQMGAATEMYGFWYQLYLVNLAPVVTGASAGSPRVQVGVNIPRSSFEGVGYSVYQATDATVFPFFPKGKHVIAEGITNSVDSNYIPHNPFLTPRQAYAIDSKFDDGLAGSGRMTGTNGYGGYATYPCANLPSTTAYNLTSAQLTCFFNIGMAF